MSFIRLRLLLPAALLAVSALATTAPLAAHADTLCNGGGRIIVGSGTSLALSNCSVSGNNLTGFNDGAGIENHGMLTLGHVSITNNHTDLNGNGGGIDNDGTITGSDVTISNNSAGSGGGIRNSGGGQITLTNSTISGNSAYYGGGVLNLQNVATSTLTLKHSIVTGNTSTNDGGGIYNSAVQLVGATLIVDHSTISMNHSGVDGGGIADTKGTITLTDVTINDNTAQLDGGGIAESGSLVGTNVTIVHNTATVKGGGIATDTGGTTSLLNATISDNSAPSGGGGAYEGNVPGPGLPGTTLQDTLLARNSPANCLGSFASSGFNLDTGSACAFGKPGDQSNVGDAVVGLGTLADNTGAVMTEALSAASPAVDKGGVSCAITDARDLARPQGPACDIGSFELENAKRDTTPPTTTASFSGTNVGGNSYTGTVTATLSAADNVGGTGVSATYFSVDTTSCTSAALASCTKYSAPFTITGVGSHTVYFFSVDLVGNTETLGQSGFQIVLPDTTAPTTTASLAGPTDSTGKYTAPVTVTLSAADNTGGSGIAATYYGTDTASCAPAALGSCTKYTAPFTVSSAQAHTVYYFSVDRAGNKEPVKQIGFTIITLPPPDTTPPTTTAAIAQSPDGSGNYTGPITVTLSATDNPGGSGVATTYFAVDTTGCAPATTSVCLTYAGSAIPVSGDGAHSVTFFSIDKAGNAEFPHALTFTIKTAQPPPGPVTISGDYQCSSGPLAPKSVIKGKLIVGSGVNCTLTGVRIYNGVTVQSGGSLTGHSLLIGNGVQASSATSLVLDGPSGVQGDVIANNTGGVTLVAVITGNVQINNTTGAPGGGVNTICSSAMRTLQVNNSASSAPFDVGGSKDCANGNVIARDAQLNGNKGALTVSNNRIGGSLQTKDDTGGLTMSNNHVGKGGGDAHSKP